MGLFIVFGLTSEAIEHLNINICAVSTICSQKIINC